MGTFFDDKDPVVGQVVERQQQMLESAVSQANLTREQLEHWFSLLRADMRRIDQLTTKNTSPEKQGLYQKASELLRQIASGLKACLKAHAPHEHQLDEKVSDKRATTFGPTHVNRAGQRVEVDAQPDASATPSSRGMTRS